MIVGKSRTTNALDGGRASVGGAAEGGGASVGSSVEVPVPPEGTCVVESAGGGVDSLISKAQVSASKSLHSRFGKGLSSLTRATNSHSFSTRYSTSLPTPKLVETAGNSALYEVTKAFPWALFPLQQVESRFMGPFPNFSTIAP